MRQSLEISPPATPTKRLRSSLRAGFAAVHSGAPGATAEDSLAAEALISLCADSSGDAAAHACAELGTEAASAPAAAAFEASAGGAWDAEPVGGARPLQVGSPYRKGEALRRCAADGCTCVYCASIPIKLHLM